MRGRDAPATAAGTAALQSPRDHEGDLISFCDFPFFRLPDFFDTAHHNGEIAFFWLNLETRETSIICKEVNSSCSIS